MPRRRGRNAIPEKVSPALSIVYRNLEEIDRDPRNPRLHSKAQVQQIARSIQAFGFNVPFLIDQNHRLIAGHGRLAACALLGLRQVPTICLDHLSENQIRAFLIADNRLSEKATWNHRLLAEQLKDLSEVKLDFSLEATGFEISEIEVMIEGMSPAIEGTRDPGDVLPEFAKAPQVTRNGDLWLLGRHRIYCGNSLSAGSYSVLLEGRRAAMVFTDPQSNVRIAGRLSGLDAIQHENFKTACVEMSEVEFTSFLAQAFSLLASHSLDGSLHYVFMDWGRMREILAAGKQAYTELTNVCVWVKDTGGMGSLYRSQHELIFVFESGQDFDRNNVHLDQNGRQRTNVWSYPSVNSSFRTTGEGKLLALHPTIKPVAMVADAIMDSTAQGDIVLDPFLGSGTIVIAAERTGRICYGIELQPVYVDAVVRRWQRFTGLCATHGISGCNFNELEQEAADENNQ